MHGYNAKKIGGRWYTDTLFATVKSLTSKTCAQLFTNQSLITVHPMAKKSEAGSALGEFVDEVWCGILRAEWEAVHDPL